MNNDIRRWFSSEREEDDISVRSRSPYRSKRNVQSLSLSDNSEKRCKINSQTSNNSISIETELSDEDEMADSSPKTSTPKADPSHSDILSALSNISKQITNLTLSVNEIKGEIFELRNENKILKQEVGGLKKENEALRDKITEIEYRSKLAYDQANDNAQYSRINNIRWYGFKESKDENLHNEFSNMVKDKLQIPSFQVEDIEAIHRLGKFSKKQAKPRPIIVRLRRNTRDHIMSVKKKLAKSGMSLMEDLTKVNLQLYNSIKAHPIVDKIWTDHGKMIISVKDSGKVTRVNSMAHLEENATEWLAWVNPKPRPKLDGQGNQEEQPEVEREEEMDS